MALKKDWKSIISDLLLHNSEGLTYNEICEKLGGNRTTIRGDLAYLKKNKHVQHEKSTSKYTLTIPRSDWTPKMLDHAIQEHYKKSKEIRQRLRQLKRRTKKPVFEIKEETKTTFTFWNNPKARKNLENYCVLINNIFALSSALSFKNTFDLNPIEFRIQSKEYEKNILKCAKDMIDDMIKIEPKNKRCFINYMCSKSKVLKNLESHYSSIMPYGL